MSTCTGGFIIGPSFSTPSKLRELNKLILYKNYFNLLSHSTLYSYNSKISINIGFCECQNELNNIVYISIDIVLALPHSFI